MSDNDSTANKEVQQRSTKIESVRSEYSFFQKVQEKSQLVLPQSPEGQKDIVFEDLFDLEDIQRLQDEFAIATGVASMITDVDGTPITSPSNFCRFCSDIIRKTEKGLTNCIKSDAALGRLSSDGPIVQPCLSGGLWDAGAGISVGGKHIANWLIGQVRDETQTEAAMLEYARQIGADEKAFIEAFHEVPSMSRRQFGNVAQMLFTFANRLSETAYQNLQQARVISDRKQAEEKLAKFAQRLALHVEHTPLGVIEWDLNFKVVQWNRAAEKMFGYTCEEATGRHGADLIVPKSGRAQMESSWRDLLACKGGTRSVNENIAKNGKKLTCEWYNTTLVNAEGLVIGGASLVQDVSESKQLEEQLRQAHKMEAIGTMAGGIAHDFNNILAAILGYADMALDDIPEYSRAKNQIEQVIKAGNRAKELVKHILSFSRKETKNQSPVQMYLLIQETLQLLRASIPATIEIKQNIDPQCRNILADSTQIHQVLMNLCTNAAQAMDENGGVLNVELNPVQLIKEDLKNEPHLKPGDYVRLTVKDTGTGIDPKHLDRIFDPYFTTKEVGKGSGMGLAVVVGIVKSHDGMITVDSRLAEGTSFKVYFPAIKGRGQEVAEDDAPPPAGTERILVVDDEESMVDMTKQRLERLGYQVTTTTRSMEAFDLFCLEPDGFDLVITDQTMPQLTGEQLAKKMMEVRSDIPIIICTGYSSKMDAEKAGCIGVGAFIQKPVGIREFAKTIRQVLDSGKK